MALTGDSINLPLTRENLCSVVCGTIDKLCRTALLLIANASHTAAIVIISRDLTMATRRLASYLRKQTAEDAAELARYDRNLDQQKNRDVLVASQKRCSVGRIQQCVSAY